MTRFEFQIFIDLLSKQAVSDSPITRRRSLQRLYVEINQDFDDKIGSNPRLGELSQQKVTEIWGGFSAGFVCGQAKPNAGK